MGWKKSQEEEKTRVLINCWEINIEIFRHVIKLYFAPLLSDFFYADTFSTYLFLSHEGSIAFYLFMFRFIFKQKTLSFRSDQLIHDRISLEFSNREEECLQCNLLNYMPVGFTWVQSNVAYK